MWLLIHAGIKVKPGATGGNSSPFLSFIFPLHLHNLKMISIYSSKGIINTIKIFDHEHKS